VKFVEHELLLDRIQALDPRDDLANLLSTSPALDALPNVALDASLPAAAAPKPAEVFDGFRVDLVDVRVCRAGPLRSLPVGSRGE
jgi:hypothetical protein